MVYSDRYSAKDCTINIDGGQYGFSNYSEVSTTNSLVFQMVDLPLGVQKVGVFFYYIIGKYEVEKTNKNYR